MMPETVKSNSDNDLKFRAGIRPVPGSVADKGGDPDKKAKPLNEGTGNNDDLQYITE